MVFFLKSIGFMFLFFFSYTKNSLLMDIFNKLKRRKLEQKKLPFVSYDPTTVAHTEEEEEEEEERRVSNNIIVNVETLCTLIHNKRAALDVALMEKCSIERSLSPLLECFDDNFIRQKRHFEKRSVCGLSYVPSKEAVLHMNIIRLTELLINEKRRKRFFQLKLAKHKLRICEQDLLQDVNAVATLHPVQELSIGTQICMSNDFDYLVPLITMGKHCTLYNRDYIQSNCNESKHRISTIQKQIHDLKAMLLLVPDSEGFTHVVQRRFKPEFTSWKNEYMNHCLCLFCTQDTSVLHNMLLKVK